MHANNAQGELYLTDLLEMFRKEGLKVGASILDNPSEMMGVNNRWQLYEAGEALKMRINKEHMLNGVTIIDPKVTYIGPDVKIGPDTIIYPNTHIYGHTVIGNSNVIGPNTMIIDCEIGDNKEIANTTIKKERI